jgi:hypothetical protein
LRISLYDRSDRPACFFAGDGIFTLRGREPLHRLIAGTLGLRLIDQLEIDADAQVPRVNCPHAVRQRRTATVGKISDRQCREQHRREAKQNGAMEYLEKERLAAPRRPPPAIPLS